MQTYKSRFKTEYVDVLDESGQIIGKALREDCHQDASLIHAVVDIWLFNEKGEILVQKQSSVKHPPFGRYDKSCGGHVLSGDTVEETCLKEMKEELGITPLHQGFGGQANYELREGFKFVEKYLDRGEKKTHLIYLYYAFISSSTKFILEKEEVESVEWMELEKFFTLLEKSEIPVSKSAKAQVEKIMAIFEEEKSFIKE